MKKLTYVPQKKQHRVLLRNSLRKLKEKFNKIEEERI